MTPRRETLFSSVPPSNSLVSVSNPRRAYKLTRRPSRALDLPRALLPELQRHKDTVRCAALSAEVPGQRQERLMQTLIVRLLTTHLLSLFQKLKGPVPPLPPTPKWYCKMSCSG